MNDTWQMRVGRVVISRAGRDKGRCFTIVQVLDAQYVLLADGDFRKLTAPKRKKVKHLKATQATLGSLAESIANGTAQDFEIRAAMTSAGYPPHTQMGEDNRCQNLMSSK